MRRQATKEDGERLISMAHGELSKVLSQYRLDLDIGEATVLEMARVPLPSERGRIAMRVELMRDRHPRLVITRPTHRHEPVMAERWERALTVTGRGVPRFVHDVMIPYARMIERDRQIRAAGLTSGCGAVERLMPSWAYSADPIMIASLAGTGMTADEIVAKAWSDEMGKGDDGIRGSTEVMLNGPRLYRSSITLTDGDGPSATYVGKRECPFIWIDGRLPQTVLTSIVGQRLEDVVDHPWLRGSGAVITRFKASDGRGMEIGFSVQDVLMGPLPDGIGSPWHLIGTED